MKKLRTLAASLLAVIAVGASLCISASAYDANTDYTDFTLAAVTTQTEISRADLDNGDVTITYEVYAANEPIISTVGVGYKLTDEAIAQGIYITPNSGSITIPKSVGTAFTEENAKPTFVTLSWISPTMENKAIGSTTPWAKFTVTIPSTAKDGSYSLIEYAGQETVASGDDYVQLPVKVAAVPFKVGPATETTTTATTTTATETTETTTETTTVGDADISFDISDKELKLTDAKALDSDGDGLAEVPMSVEILQNNGMAGFTLALKSADGIKFDSQKAAMTYSAGGDGMFSVGIISTKANYGNLIASWTSGTSQEALTNNVTATGEVFTFTALVPIKEGKYNVEYNTYFETVTGEAAPTVTDLDMNELVKELLAGSVTIIPDETTTTETTTTTDTTVTDTTVTDTTVTDTTVTDTTVTDTTVTDTTVTDTTVTDTTVTDTTVTDTTVTDTTVTDTTVTDTTVTDTTVTDTTVTDTTVTDTTVTEAPVATDKLVGTETKIYKDVVISVETSVDAKTFNGETATDVKDVVESKVETEVVAGDGATSYAFTAPARTFFFSDDANAWTGYTVLKTVNPEGGIKTTTTTTTTTVKVTTVTNGTLTTTTTTVKVADITVYYDKYEKADGTTYLVYKSETQGTESVYDTYTSVDDKRTYDVTTEIVGTPVIDVKTDITGTGSTTPITTDITNDVTFDFANAKAAWTGDKNDYTIKALDGTTEVGTFDVMIGLRGDADCDFVVTTDDASEVLLYLAKEAVNQVPDNITAFGKFLADVDETSYVDGTNVTKDTTITLVTDDCSYILAYLAKEALDGSADWAEIIVK